MRLLIIDYKALYNRPWHDHPLSPAQIKNKKAWVAIKSPHQGKLAGADITHKKF